MDFEETEEQKMTRRMTREFAQNEVKPVCREFEKNRDPKDCYPWELLKKVSQLGLRTLSIPAEYGGGGITDLITYIIVCEELAAGDHGFASSIRSVIGLAAMMNVLCTQQQKDEWFPKMVKDDAFLIAMAGTEPNSGTDNSLMANIPGAAMQTFAEKRGSEYIINGTKHFISNGGIAKLTIVSARTDRKLPLNQSLSRFLVSSDTPGFSIGKLHDKLGRRCLITAELVFEDMRVPAGQLLGQEGKALKEASRASFLPFLLCACTLGLLGAMYDSSVEYASNRVQGGKPIIGHQLIARHLSEMRVRIEAARQLLYRQAWCWQNKRDYDPKLTILLRTFIDQCAAHIAFQVNDIHGGMGSDKEIIVEKYIRDIFTSLHGPTIGQGLIRGAPGWTPELSR